MLPAGQYFQENRHGQLCTKKYEKGLEIADSNSRSRNDCLGNKDFAFPIAQRRRKLANGKGVGFVYGYLNRVYVSNHGGLHLLGRVKHLLRTDWIADIAPFGTFLYSWPYTRSSSIWGHSAAYAMVTSNSNSCGDVKDGGH